jgi:hypothetical protein
MFIHPYTYPGIHRGGVDKYKCPECGKPNPDKSSLNKHVKVCMSVCMCVCVCVCVMWGCSLFVLNTALPPIYTQHQNATSFYTHHITTPPLHFHSTHTQTHTLQMVHKKTKIYACKGGDGCTEHYANEADLKAHVELVHMVLVCECECVYVCVCMCVNQEGTCLRCYVNPAYS